MLIDMSFCDHMLGAVKTEMLRENGKGNPARVSTRFSEVEPELGKRRHYWKPSKAWLLPWFFLWRAVLMSLLMPLFS